MEPVENHLTDSNKNSIFFLLDCCTIASDLLFFFRAQANPLDISE